MSKTIIFLDFDGVLCDSVKEAYLLSRYAFYGISPFEKIDNENFEKLIDGISIFGISIFGILILGISMLE